MLSTRRRKRKERPRLKKRIEKNRYSNMTEKSSEWEGEMYIYNTYVCMKKLERRKIKGR